MSEPARRGRTETRPVAGGPAEARPEAGHELPRPTIWPAGLAAAIALLAAGLATHWLVGLSGGLLLVVSLWGWVQDLLGDPEAAPERDDLDESRTGDEDG